MRIWLALVLCAGTVSAAVAQPATPPPSTPARDQAQAELLPRPRVRFGDDFSLALIAKVQGDVSRFDPVVDADDEAFDWRRRRLGLRGELFGRVTFEVEYEFSDETAPWRDAYANLRVVDALEIRGGHFRVPFSLDNLTGSTSHDFVNRSLAARILGPGRDVGLMVHGQTDRRRLSYAVGVFDGDDERSDDSLVDDDKGADSLGRTYAGRVTVQPFDSLERLPRGLRNLELGANTAWSSLPDGLNGFRGRSVYGHEFFAPVYVNGDRVVAGVDALLTAGPTSLRAEWMQAWDERRGQGLGDKDLPRAFGRGWYVAATWLLTGEDKDGDVRPRRPFLQGGIGALETAVRYERLTFGSTGSGGEPPFANPRAANLLRNRDDVVTVGVMWHLNRWFKLMGNAIHESFDDLERAPIVGIKGFWSYVGRVQFAM